MKTKAKDPTTTTAEAQTVLTVQSVEGSETSKGKFVRFVANSQGVQWQVWLRNATIQKWNIQARSALTLDPATVAIASWYDPATKSLKLDAEGNEQQAPIVYEYTGTDGVTYKYPFGRGMLDMSLTVTGCDNSGVKVLKAFNPL